MSGRLNDLSRTIRQLVGFFFFLEDLIRAKRSEERHLIYDYIYMYKSTVILGCF